MPDPRDLLPPPPWEGPPLPKSVWEYTLAWKLQESILLQLGDIMDDVRIERERLPRYIELISPYAKEWERKALTDLSESLSQIEDKILEAIVAIGEIRQRGVGK